MGAAVGHCGVELGSSGLLLLALPGKTCGVAAHPTVWI